MDTKGSLSGQIIYHLTCKVLPFLNINTICYSSVVENDQILVAASVSWEGMGVLCSIILKNKARSKNSQIQYFEEIQVWTINSSLILEWLRLLCESTPWFTYTSQDQDVKCIGNVASLEQVSFSH